MSKQSTNGNDLNHLVLVVDNLEVQRSSKGIVVKINSYDLEHLLIQLLEDYGENVLMEKIAQL